MYNDSLSRIIEIMKQRSESGDAETLDAIAEVLRREQAPDYFLSVDTIAEMSDALNTLESRGIDLRNATVRSADGFTYRA